MSGNAEIGIAAIHAKVAQKDGVAKYHASTIGYLNERILTFVFSLSFIGLILVWMTSPSPLIVYGSLAVVIILAVACGILWIKRIQKNREQQARQAQEWRTGAAP
jgi:MFS superfamily sulfate permease-like transporter